MQGQVAAKIYNAFGKPIDTVKCSNDGGHVGPL